MIRLTILTLCLCCSAAWAQTNDTMPIVTKPAPVYSRPLPEVPFQGPRSAPLTEEELQPEKPLDKPITPKIVTPRVDTPTVEAPARPRHPAVEQAIEQAIEPLPELEKVDKEAPKPTADAASKPTEKTAAAHAKPAAKTGKAPAAYTPTLAVPIPGIVSGLKQSSFLEEARKAFLAADKDGDGVLREEEMLQLKAPE